MYKTKQLVLVGFLSLILGSLFAAQKKPAAKTEETSQVNPTQIEILRGSVVKLDSMRPMMKMRLQTDRENVIVDLGPSWYFQKMNFHLYPSDNVAVTGYRSTEEGVPIFIAMQVKKGGSFLTLRDQNGNPVWGAQDLME